MRIHRLIPATVLVLLFSFLTGEVLAADQAETESAKKEVFRVESDLSFGAVLNNNARIGIVKSWWWYPLPKIIALGVSLDYIGSFLPISLIASFNLPLPVVVPFVYAGAGLAFSRGGVTHFGGGLKLRFSKKIGLIAEYRKYSHKPDPFLYPSNAPRVWSDYIGLGIAYFY